MKKNNILFIVWGILVIGLIALLTITGFILKDKKEEYKELEAKLKRVTSSYVDHNFLYPENGEKLKINTNTLIDNEFLTSKDLQVGKDSCTGYVTLKEDMVYEYKAYIKCHNYTTKGY